MKVTPVAWDGGILPPGSHSECLPDYWGWPRSNTRSLATDG
jgi:hypothetical protein